MHHHQLCLITRLMYRQSYSAKKYPARDSTDDKLKLNLACEKTLHKEKQQDMENTIRVRERRQSREREE